MTMYEAKDYSHLLGTAGFSDALLNNHFKLYQGYVTNTNKAAEMLKDSALDPYLYGEVKRRFGWEFSGMRLHELYFGNMTKEESQGDWESPLVAKMTEQWGSPDAWKADFLATGAMRGIGWVVLYHDPEANMLFNTWINEHDLGHLTGCTPLLVMDVFEHAFMLDYGLDKKSYLEAFWKAIDWKAVQERYKA